jgi:hypothetical protein
MRSGAYEDARSPIMRFFSAAFGDAYVSAARALLSSFARYAPKADIRLFTDRTAAFDDRPGATVTASLDDLLAELGELLPELPGQRRNAFKFVLFEHMRRLYPQDDLCWIDADMLMLDDPASFLRPGHVNVMAHGRRNGQVISCGDGLNVPGDRYAIGGCYALPAGGAEAYLRRTHIARESWADVASLVRTSGDQVTLNHLVARSGLEVHWFTDDRTRIFNLEIGDGLHPGVGDQGLAGLSLQDGKLMRDGRRVAIFCWIKSRLDAHLADGFKTFQPEVREWLRRIYDPTDSNTD